MSVHSVRAAAAIRSVRMTLPRRISVSALRTWQRTLSPKAGATVRRSSSHVITLTLPAKGAKADRR